MSPAASHLQAYRASCAAKRPVPLAHGLQRIPALNSSLFPHQVHGVEFALRIGRSALFYDTGLGKTAQMLEWGRCVVEETNKPVLMLAPLAVSAQHIREADAAFQAAYRPLVRDLFRVTKPGRLSAIHVKDLVYYSNASEKGDRGLRDFTGDCIRTHIAEGWTYHRRITIWRCPVREMQKTKSDRLLYKNFRTDGARTGGGLPEYIVVFRKWADGMTETPAVLHSPAEYPLEAWQNYAQPSYTIEDHWTDTDETDTLNVRIARDEDAEKHLCPMPLDLTERLIRQYTNPQEVVYSPFMGVGSEGYVALRHNRRFIGTELKPSYFRQACKYLDEAERLGPASDLLSQVEVG